MFLFPRANLGAEPDRKGSLGPCTKLMMGLFAKRIKDSKAFNYFANNVPSSRVLNTPLTVSKYSVI